MKKSITMFLALLLVSVSAMAATVAVQPDLNVNFRDEFKTAVGGGAKVNVAEVPYLPKEVVLSTGLNYSQLSTADNLVQDVDVYTIPLEVGYEYAIDSKLAVKPYVGLDIILADSKVIDNTIGGHLGAEIAYKVTDNISASLNAGWAFAETDVLGEKKSLNGAVLGGGVSYKF